MRTRHKGRVLAIQTLYALDFNNNLFQGCKVDNLAALSDKEIEEIEKDAIIFAWYLINGTVENLNEIDETIENFSNNRPLEAIDYVDRNILRISIFSLKYMTDTHPSIIIDEAVKLSQQFSKEVNYRFINGILDAVRKSYDKN